MFTRKDLVRRATPVIMWQPAGRAADLAESDPRRKHGGILACTCAWLAVGLALSGVCAAGPQTTRGDIEVVSAQVPLYISSASAGIYKSLDDGQSWFPVNNGLGNLIVHCLAGGSSEGLGCGKLFAGTKDGVYRTKDGGISWTACGLDSLRVRDLDIDPATKTVYAATDDGIYATSARSERIYWWHLGLAGHDIRRVRVCYGQNNYIYAAGALPGAVETRVFKSSDGGGTWSSQRVLNYYMPWAFAVNPEDPAYVYVGSSGDGILGMYARSTDGGETWEYGPFSWVPDIDVHRAHPNIVVVAEFTQQYISRLWKSEDHGDTWRQVFDITQFPADFLTAVALHPHSSSTMYCTAFTHQGPTGLLYFGKTYDDGETWTFCQQGLPEADGSDILLDGVPPTPVQGDPWAW